MEFEHKQKKPAVSLGVLLFAAVILTASLGAHSYMLTGQVADGSPERGRNGRRHDRRSY